MLYFGKTPIKINFRGVACKLRICPPEAIFTYVVLLNAKNEILTDADGLYITVRGEDD